MIDQLSAQQAEQWHSVLAASLAHDLPGQPLPTLEQLTTPGLDSRRLFWLADEPDGTVSGAASLRLFDRRGQEHLAELELYVHPDWRRRGVGSRLLAQVVLAAQAENRRSLVAGVGDIEPGTSFCAARNFERVLTLRHLLLDLSEVDLEVADPAGYRLRSWAGTVPDELADAFATAKNAMNDMPTGDMDYGTQQWDAERVRAMAWVVADRGDTLLTAAALHGEVVAGFTEIVIRAGEQRRALQYDTVVVPAHRGHGLGRWLKTAMVRQLRAEHPGIVEIETDNADDNTHMIAVNERMGFREHRRAHTYQLKIS
ncbi:GNAT family N-acetyltransferase [Lentzea flava]|uniref:N-acetyltransferase n=1 Tax=Lentzea flava TaxID=103732 RepID=A0ABQ2UVF7_9PSEU|nr:GNAT family N-acetyltransferase [Lentzea flava]MCP2200790.1 mycothiol synthase [Lentzea flava]GGU55597.1 N-acetyltransferase [Lentzea flava]